jgi:hypothetical protein
MTVIETTELFSAIKEGYFDAALREIAAAVRSRDFVLANQIKVGDRVRITGAMDPKYSVGATAIVQERERRGKKNLFWVLFEPAQKQLEGYKFGYPEHSTLEGDESGWVGLPINCVSKLEA